MMNFFAASLFLIYFFPTSSTFSSNAYGSKMLGKFLEAINETSLACHVTLHHCQGQFPEAARRYQNRDLCGYMKSTRHGVTFHDCMVSAGFCTMNEFNNLTNIACHETNSILLEVSEAMSMFYQALYATSAHCIRHLLSCIERYVIALIYKTEESYCHLMDIKFDHSFCYKSPASCSEEEIDNLVQTACVMPLSEDPEVTTDGSEREKVHFSDTLSFCSNSCLWSFHSCVRSAGTFLTPYLFSQRYCDLVGVLALKNQTFKECIVDNGQCSFEEYAELYIHACSHATVFGFSWIYTVLLISTHVLYNSPLQVKL